MQEGPGSAVIVQVSTLHTLCPCRDGQALGKVSQGIQCPVTSVRRFERKLCYVRAWLPGNPNRSSMSSLRAGQVQVWKPSCLGPFFQKVASLREHSQGAARSSGAAPSHSAPVVQGLAARAREVLRALACAAELRTAARKPLTRRGAGKAPEIKLLNPRFEEEYAAGEPGLCLSPAPRLFLVIT